MEINWYGLVIGILITYFSYMLISIILKLKNGSYDESKDKEPKEKVEKQQDHNNI